MIILRIDGENKATSNKLNKFIFKESFFSPSEHKLKKLDREGKTEFVSAGGLSPKSRWDSLN